MPVHGTVRLSDHCHNMLDMYLAVCPKEDQTLNMVRAIQFHDVPERWLGDMPAPIKKGISGFKEMESHVMSVLGIGYTLNNEESNWLWALDKAELLFWCKDQLALGNQNVHQMYLKLAAWFQEREEAGNLPKEMELMLEAHEWGRLDDNLPGVKV